MKKLSLIILLSLLFTIKSQAYNHSCGIREISKAMAVINLELDLLSGSRYEKVRVSTMKLISSKVKNYLLQAQMCTQESENLRVSTIDTVNRLVMYNSDSRPYSINTAKRIFGTFKDEIQNLEEVAGIYLNSLIINNIEIYGKH